MGETKLKRINLEFQPESLIIIKLCGIKASNKLAIVKVR
jgi:hypothetical protein